MATGSLGVRFHEIPEPRTRLIVRRAGSHRARAKGALSDRAVANSIARLHRAMTTKAVTQIGKAP
jgi:hypothetical protein